MATVAQPLTVVEFDAALRTLATRAQTRYAGESARIDRGLVLALNGHVTLHADGTARVQSERNPDVQYRIAHGRCDCPDAPWAPEHRCKHVWARCLARKARKLTEALAATAQWYATYLSDERAQLTGIATYTPQGWVFIPEDAPPIYDVTLRDLCLLGHVPTVTMQYADDLATGELAWMATMTWTGHQMMA